MHPFHLAIPVHDLAAARAFYGELLGCPEGRSSESWVDFNLHGHQLVAHLAPQPAQAPRATGTVDSQRVPIPHFGLVLERSAWEALAARLRDADVTFILEPTTRYAGQPSEQSMLFLEDPSGNALEFKTYAHPEHLFARDADVSS